MAKIHFLTLDVGDRFRFRDDGPTFERAPDREGKVMVRKAGEPRQAPAAILEFEGCYVIPIDDDPDPAELEDDPR